MKEMPPLTPLPDVIEVCYSPLHYITWGSSEFIQYVRRVLALAYGEQYTIRKDDYFSEPYLRSQDPIVFHHVIAIKKLTE